MGKLIEIINFNSLNTSEYIQVIRKWFGYHASNVFTHISSFLGKKNAPKGRGSTKMNLYESGEIIQ